MEIIYQSEIEYLSPCVATMGFFDGLHAGHRFLIDELKSIAKRTSLNSVVITFAIHPRKVLNKDFQPELLTTLPEKLRQLESTGIDRCVVLDFSLQMAKLTAFDFLNTILKQQLNVQTLLIGHDHRFGHNRLEGFPEYKKYGNELGMEVIQASQYNTVLDKHISSSEIRNSLKRGDIECANRLLTYEYSLQGKVIEGFKIGRTIGFPTANIGIFDPEKIIPGTGVYAVHVYWNQQRFKGMMNIGHRPTLDNGQNITLEVHIIGFEEDIYNQSLEISFICKIREEQKFAGIDELKEQLRKDKLYVVGLPE